MLKAFFSMKMAVVVLFVFGIMIGVATFIENDYGTQTAKALIYNAHWFELFLFYFIAILIYNMIQFKSYKNRLPVFIFHLSFVVIAIGALITRFVGYEGILHIREGQASDTMITDAKVLQLQITKDGETKKYEKNLYLSTMTQNHFSELFTLDNSKLKMELVDYMPNAQKAIIDDLNGTKILEFKIAGGQGRGKIVPLSSGDEYDAGNFIITYNKHSTSNKPQFIVSDTNGTLSVDTTFDMSYFKMDDRTQGEVSAGHNPLETRHLYQFDSNAVVLKSIHEKAKLEYVSEGIKANGMKPELVKLTFRVDDQTKTINLLAYKGETGKEQNITIGDISIQATLGAKDIKLPFSIKLTDFQLERYPGSMTPSSYASEVVLIDKEQNIHQPYRIYMNHVLDHRNYRLFQSSYDMDEKGTILSVNHDPGTIPTYIGYLLLAIGMIWSLFHPNSRFQSLLKKTRKLQENALLAAFMLLLSSQTSLKADDIRVDTNVSQLIQKYDLTHAQKFGHLAVQDFQGRMKPLNTLAHDVVSKISGKSSILNLAADQVLLGMITKPSVYQNIAMIKIGHPQIALNLGLPQEAKYARFSDFFDSRDNSYKLQEEVDIAARKKPLDQSQYDKELLKIDERANVAYMVFSGSLLQIYPKPKDKNNKWLSPLDGIEKFSEKESQIVQLITMSYFQSIEEGIKSGDWSKANEALDVISRYQEFYGEEVIPSTQQIDLEIKYNNLGLFSKLVPLYLILGIVLLISAFVQVIKPTLNIQLIVHIGWYLLLVGFVIHIVGLGLRWYIAGHAPWSNAYESIVFIAAATVIAGLILAKKSPFALAGTALLAGITMAVAHMNFINPEITNLVPVLKSYWLMIHVATIISGDGFLGLGSILSLFVLLLFIIKKEGNENIDRSIKELTNLAEMSLIIGLMLMTVGNFLGGVWANESWGRYWGWDPKETWAAVTILIYATVLHLRFIPKLKSIYIFNVASVWAYSSVLMTYFGVNYYLSGLHSYAAGDPIPFPMWAWYSIAGLLILTLLAARNRALK